MRQRGADARAFPSPCEARPMRRLHLVALGLVSLACSGEASRPPSSASPSPLAAPASSTVLAPTPAPDPAAPSPPTSRVRATPSATDLARARARLAEARRADRAGDHEGALAALDEVLAVLPSDPRLMCEAGFVAHRAGRSELAATRIDAALAAFGPPGAQRGADVPRLAQCLYNRGLVDEARGDLVGAADHFRASLALRPNAAVESALHRASTRAAEGREGETMGGVPVEVGARSMLVHARDRTALETAMRVGLAGLANDGSTDRTTDETRVEVLAEGSGLVLYGVTTPDFLSTEQDVIVARPEGDGFRLVLAAGEYASTEHGDVVTISGARITTLDRFVRVDFEVASTMYLDDDSFDDEGAGAPTCAGVTRVTSRDVRTIVCRTTPELACFALATQHASEDDLEVDCYDEGGRPVDPPDAGAPSTTSYALTLAASAEGALVIGVGRGTPPDADTLVGTHTFDELVAGSLTHALSFVAMTDRARASEAEEMDEGEDEE